MDKQREAPMRVNMKIEERAEKVSMFKSMQIHAVVADVQLSEEETAAIHQLKLGDYELITIPCFLPIDLKTIGTEHTLGVSALLNQPKYGPITLQYPDPVQAQNGMAELKQRLTKLKEIMTTRA